MGMDHQLGQPGLINWQSRKLRRPSSRLGVWTILVTLCAIAGLASLAGQLAGWIHFKGLLAALPAVLLILAVNAQLFAGARAAFAWLAG
jgi:hypothetical protein